jgi:diacylglycerol kinase (ATP)
MAMGHILLFANPISGRGRGKAAALEIQNALLARGHTVTPFLSKASSLTWKQTGPIEAAIVIGGDGTLRGVAQWAIDAALIQQPAGKSLPYPLLIVPMGTANLMGRHLGISWHDENFAAEVADAVEHHRIVNLDVARTNDGVFLLMAGIGFDAWIVHELDRMRSGPIDLTDYLMPAVKAVTEYRFPSLTVSVDGKTVFRDAPALAMVGNVREYGTGFAILPDARPDDQLLDICVMPCSSRGKLVRLFLAAMTGDHITWEGVVYMKGKQIRIDSPDRVPVQVDGEPGGHTPLVIDLLPTRIPFIVPST